MKTYEAIEQAYKNGYRKGYEDGRFYAGKHDACERCKNSAEMLVIVKNKVKDTSAKVKWLGGQLPAKFCPFCGRKLNLKEGVE